MHAPPKNLVAALVGILASACTSSTSNAPSGGDSGPPGAADDGESPLPPGVQVEALDGGGVRYTLTRAAFTVTDAAGDAGFAGDDFVLPRAERPRKGCFFETRWLPVTAPGATPRTWISVDAFPRIQVEWWGQSTFADNIKLLRLLELHAVFRGKDGEDDRGRVIRPELLTLDPPTPPDGGESAYHGLLDIPSRGVAGEAFGHFNLGKGDEVQLRLCEAAAGVRVVVRSVSFVETRLIW
jgi:hypothetical protein